MLSNIEGEVSSRYKRITLLAISFLFSIVSIISAQRTKEPVPPLRERLFFGGGLGLQFGTITDIQFTPIVGLWVQPRIAVAVGPNYRYYKDPLFSTSIYGGNAYVQFVPLRDLNNIIPIGVHLGIFLQLEDEMLSLESAVWDAGNPDTRFVANTLLGGFGISQSMGRRSSFNLAFLWALNNTVYGLYSNPEIRISFTF